MTWRNVRRAGDVTNTLGSEVTACAFTAMPPTIALVLAMRANSGCAQRRGRGAVEPE
jgi:hypothetical protein